MKNEPFLFESPTPSPEPVNAAQLLTEIETTIKRHVILGDDAAAALAVWVLHTYSCELRDAVAYVAIESPEKRCGKTTLISVLAAMAHKPLIASNISVAALFRAIDVCRPTLFIDEADTFLAGNGAMRGIINSGNTWRTAYVVRLSRGKRSRADADSQPGGASVLASRSGQPAPEVTEAGLKRYSCWCPKVIALIGEVPDTIADRSIVVKMSRKLTTESCAPLTELNVAQIKSKCARFFLDARESIAQAAKIRCEGLNDRAADTFDPLCVIARLAGGDWERKLSTAAMALTSAAQAENASVELLLDILSIFLQSSGEKIFSRDLAAALRQGSGGMKSLAFKDSQIEEFGLARILRPYGIRPTTMRIGKYVNKGFTLLDFREALNRYVPMSVVDARLTEIQQRLALIREALANPQQQQKEAA